MNKRASIEELLRDLRILKWTTIILTVLLLGVSGIAWLDLASKGNEAVRTHNGVCTLRADLQDRVKQAKAFLVKHPHGGGIGSAVVKQNITNTNKTIEALTLLNCKEPKQKK